MKRRLFAMLAAILALCASVALASDNVKFTSSAYVYAQSGSDRTDIVIRKGSVAQCAESDGAWARVRIGRNEGWVRAACLAPTDEAVKVVYSAAAAQADAVRSATVLRGVSVSAIDEVQVTSTSAPDASALETVRPGETVVCVGNYVVREGSDAYVEIRYGGTTGWVPAAALSGLPDFG